MWRALPAVGLLLALAASAHAAEERFELDAESSGMRTENHYRVRVVGHEAEVALRDWRGAEAGVDRLTLLPEESRELRRALDEARFLDDGEWTRPPHEHHEIGWVVRVEVGDRVRERTFPGQQPEFQTAARWLDRLARQFWTVRLLTEATDARGAVHAAIAAGEALDGKHAYATVLRPAKLREDLVPALRSTLPKVTEGWTAQGVLSLLARVESADAWTADVAAAAAARPEKARLRFIYCAMRASGELPEAAAHLRAVVPLVQGEVRASWRDFASDLDRRNDLRGLIEFLARQADPAVIALVEEVAEQADDGEDDAPRELAGVLARLGEAAHPAIVRLLESERQTARSMGSVAAASLFWSALNPARDDARTDDQRAAAAARLRADLLPAVERVAARPDEAVPSRIRCFEILESLGLRESRRDRKAREQDERRRRAAEREAATPPATPAPPPPEPVPPPPRGELEITGRVVDEAGRPLADIAVRALREDGPPHQPWRVHGSARTNAEGEFRIDGLTSGACALFASRWGRWSRMESGLETRLLGVQAGSSGVVLVHEQGGTIRGRVVDAAGAPVRKRTITARRRGENTNPLPMGRDVLGWDQTGDDGTFWFVRLLPGAYDLEVVGHASVDGAAGIETGAGDVVVRLVQGASIEGSVVDELGDTLGGATVTAWPADEPSRTSRASVRDDGTFVMPDLAPEQRYVVTASLHVGPHAKPPYVQRTDVGPGTRGLLLRIDTSPRLAGRVDAGIHDFALEPPVLRFVHVGSDREMTSKTSRFDWRAVADGRWRVLAHVRRLDAAGEPVEEWVEVGVVESGRTGLVLQVPR